jgi:hypothetical protein
MLASHFLSARGRWLLVRFVEQVLIRGGDVVAVAFAPCVLLSHESMGKSTAETRLNFAGNAGPHPCYGKEQVGRRAAASSVDGVAGAWASLAQFTLERSAASGALLWTGSYSWR